MDLDDLAPQPFEQFGRWFDEVAESGLHEPTAMVLATASTMAVPSARHVLLKGFDERGFRWFTNYGSTKARQLTENPMASLVFPWHALRRQVIVAGPVSRVSEAESDDYFASRDRTSQLGAWASAQSEEIPDRRWLEARLDEVTNRFADGPVPRPPHWGGFRLAPDSVEFWHSRPNRLHDRLRYVRDAGGTGWRIVRLSP